MTDGILATVRRFEAAAFLAGARLFRVTVAFLFVEDVMHELLRRAIRPVRKSYRVSRRAHARGWSLAPAICSMRLLGAAGAGATGQLVERSFHFRRKPRSKK